MWRSTGKAGWVPPAFFVSVGEGGIRLRNNPVLKSDTPRKNVIVAHNDLAEHGENQFQFIPSGIEQKWILFSMSKQKL